MTDFQIWWEAYPMGDGFKHKGQVFKRTRALRLNEAKCEKKFKEIAKKGFLVEDMVAAMNREIESRKEQSLRTGENKMRFMQNSYAYLNAGTFEAWMEDEEETNTTQTEELVDPKDLF